VRKIYIGFRNNSTEETEAQQSKPISSLIATRLPLSNTTYRRSQKNSTGSLTNPVGTGKDDPIGEAAEQETPIRSARISRGAGGIGCRKVDLFSFNQSPGIQRNGSKDNADFSVPEYNTLRPRIKRLADVYQPLSGHQEKSYCFLMTDKAKKCD
jgi:hypothetical protein